MYACDIRSHNRRGHDHVLVDLSNKPVTLFRGSVRAVSDQAVAGALVEVLDVGATARLPTETAEDARTRAKLAACITGQAGGFTFDLPPGPYELLASKPDWNSTSVLIVVDARRGKRRDIVIPLKVGD
jgi:hypothetical protein